MNKYSAVVFILCLIMEPQGKKIKMTEKLNTSRFTKILKLCKVKFHIFPTKKLIKINEVLTHKRWEIQQSQSDRYFHLSCSVVVSFVRS